MSKQLNFSITRHPMPVIQQAVIMVVITDLIFALCAMVVVVIRDTLEVDATFGVVLWLAYFAKMFLSAYGIYKLLGDWLNDSYFVINNQLIINSKTAKKSSSSRGLNELRKVSVDQTNMGKRRGYGNVKLEFASSEHREDVVLLGISDPDKIAAVLSGVAKTK